MRHLRPVLCISLLLSQLLLGCTGWRVQSVTPQQLIETKRPQQVRVRTVDGVRVVFRNPHIQSDSLVGVVRGLAAGVPIAKIDQVAVRAFSLGKTGLLILAFPAALMGAFGLGCLIGGNCSSFSYSGY